MEVRQNNLIENPNDVKKAKENTESRLRVPAGYYPIRLCTKGKLSVPEILHFKNFDMQHMIDLSTVKDEEEKMFTLIQCVQDMCYEDIKCEDLHESELTEILMNVYFMFNGSEIGPYEYVIDESNPDETHTVYFNSGHFNINEIDDKIQEPIKIKDFKFQFPRIKNTLIAREYVLEKYKAQKEEFLDLEYRLNHNKNSKNTQLNIDSVEKEKYDNYIKSKARDFVKVYQCSLLTGDSNKEFSIEESIQKFENNEIDLKVWTTFNNVVKNYPFGLSDTIEFECPKSKKLISRRFLFQSTDFIPDLESEGDTDYDVSFGD